MDALTLLTNRASQPLLTEPAPDAAAMATLLAAAARAPDHARLRPWRFICVRGDARNRLGDGRQHLDGRRYTRASGPAVAGDHDAVDTSPNRGPRFLGAHDALQQKGNAEPVAKAVHHAPVRSR